MAAVPVWRSVRRVRREVALLPRILITPKRNESEGKGAERSGGSKTLVSFPVKQPHVWPSATGENPAHPSTILHHLEVARESSVDPGQKTARSEPRQEEDDSSSSSSSDSSSSDSDSDLEEDKKRKEAAEEKKKDQSDPKWGSNDQKTQTGQPGTREQEILGGETAGEDLTHVPQAVGILKQKPKLQNIPHAGEKTTTGDQDLTGEQSNVAPGVDTKSGKKTLSGGQDLAEELLIDVAPAVDTKVQNIPQSMEKTPSGGQDLAGEDLVDVASAVDTKSKEKTPNGGQDLVGEDLVDVAPAVDTKSKEKTPSGGQDLAGEDLVDVVPTLGTEKPAHGEAWAPEQAVEGRLASSQGQDVGEMQSSGGNNKDLSEEPSVSSPDRLAESDDLSPSLTPPPPSAAPPPEEPFDNSKYQNQQHFSYTPFTFVDYDVDLSKYRLPQPSSGRPSPYQ
ncbi:NADH dehydrogenase [ubiquinone] flavoprotein 3, mitochondrial [Aquarana catesbeiana]|uniref:NADH dehydrogenase [ubiquinone] flavoprotein 3, mitochondrial n=1 Tax=Aquarana catesbeiana TaxID=8400 RepID=UPI003CC94080